MIRSKNDASSSLGPVLLELSRFDYKLKHRQTIIVNTEKGFTLID